MTWNAIKDLNEKIQEVLNTKFSIITSVGLFIKTQIMWFSLLFIILY